MINCPLCEVGGCDRPALSGNPRCVVHLQDTQGCMRRLEQRLTADDPVSLLCLAGTTWSGLQVGGRRFEFCSFTAATLVDGDFSRARLSFVYFDDAELFRCSFAGASLRHCVFGGARLRECRFTDAEVLHCNFLGARCEDTDFSDSDLYASRFTSAVLSGVRMVNCNLKETCFDARHRGEADLTASNVEDAVFGGRR